MKETDKEELQNILKKLVQFPTENPPGKTDEIINYLIAEVFREEAGYHNKIISYKKKDVKLHNLITTIGTGKEKIILCGHFDVVPAGDLNKWNYHPFSAEIVDDKLYGRGAADMKGGIAMLIGVIKNLKKITEFLEKYTLVFLGTADEEAGMTGALISSRKGVMKNSIQLIVAEPTNLNIGIGEKGLFWVNLDVYGKSAHGSMPHEGINSIECALNLIPQLYDCLEDKTNKILGKSTLNVGKIEGGTVINVVPEKTTLQIDYRLIPEQKEKVLMKKLKEIKINPCSLEVKITKSLPALQTETNHPFIQKLKQQRECQLIGLPYATDAAVLLNPKTTVPFIIYGPGDPEVIHKANEFISLEKMYQSVDLLTEALLQTYLK